MDGWFYIIGFYLVAGVAVLAAAAVLFLRNLFHAGLALILSLFAVAGLFVLLGAEFLAGVQVLIYIGGIAVLILFAVMLTQRITARRVRHYSRALVPAAAAVFGLTIVVALVSRHGRAAALAPPPPGDVIGAFAGELLSTYLLPFEVVSLLLLGALVGAVVLARKEERK